MKKNLSLAPFILMLIFNSCSFSELPETETTTSTSTTIASDLMYFDIRSLESVTNTTLSKGISDRKGIYTLSPSSYLFTPTKFVIKLATIALTYGDQGGGNTLVQLFHKANDSDCIALDLAKGESLAKITEVSSKYSPNPVTSIFIAYLPTIEYEYKDESGTTHSGQLVLPMNKHSGGYNYEIGTKLGRIANQLALSEAEFGWGDTSFTLSEDPSKRVITLFVELEKLLKEDHNPPDGVIDSLAHNGQKMYPVVPGMMFDEYYFRKNGEPGSDYPHKISVLYTASGDPVCLKLFIDRYESPSANISEIDAMQWEGNLNKDESWKRNPDGTITFMFPNGSSLPNLPRQDQTNIPLGNSFYDMKYVRKVF